MEDMLYVGVKLRSLRKRAMLTQPELAEMSGVGVTTVLRIEKNQVEPQFGTIRKLASALGVDASELVR